MGNIKRVSWSTPEKLSANNVFKQNIENEVLPSVRFCTEVLSTETNLQNRTPTQLCAWVNKQIKARQRKNCHKCLGK